MERPEDFAIVIGISEYEELPALRGSAADAEAFALWLADTEVGAGIPKGNILLLVAQNDPKAGLAQLQNAFEEVYERHLDRPGRRLYVYASGHGYSNEGVGTVLMAADASLEMAGRAIDLVAYADGYLDAESFEEVALFADGALLLSSRLVPITTPTKPELQPAEYGGSKWNPSTPRAGAMRSEVRETS